MCMCVDNAECIDFKHYFADKIWYIKKLLPEGLNEHMTKCFGNNILIEKWNYTKMFQV